MRTRTKRTVTDPTPEEIRRAKTLIRFSWRSKRMREALKLSPEPWRAESELVAK